MLRIRIRRIRMFLGLLDPDPHLDTDPLVRRTDPRIQIRIHLKMSWIRNTAAIVLTIYVPVPVVYMARNEIILMVENLFRGPFEGVGTEIET